MKLVSREICKRQERFRTFNSLGPSAGLRILISPKTLKNLIKVPKYSYGKIVKANHSYKDDIFKFDSNPNKIRAISLIHRENVCC